MIQQEMIDLVITYFAGVDSADFDAIAKTMTDDCIFTVETHGVRLQGKGDIEQMFVRLWDNHATVCHKDFTFVPSPADHRIAAQFTVVNTHHDGSETYKSNCNFFKIRESHFSHVAVYMTGENTLNS